MVYLDSKFPLENYLKYCDAKEDATRKLHRDAFLKNVEQRVKELEKRDYVNQSDRLALDTVLLFIPNDGVVAFIQENKPTLIDEAASKKVVFCSPLTLYMFLSMMHQAASSFYMEQNANEVLRLLQKFSKSWTAYVKYLKEVAKHFDKIQKKLKAVTSGRVFGAVNKRSPRLRSWPVCVVSTREAKESPNSTRQLLKPSPRMTSRTTSSRLSALMRSSNNLLS